MGLQARCANRERDPLHFAVEGFPVLRAAVVAEFFTVVPHEHHHRIAEEPERLETTEQAPDMGVCKRDLTIVSPEIVIAEASSSRFVTLVCKRCWWRTGP